MFSLEIDMPDWMADLDASGFARIPAVFSLAECGVIRAAAEGLNRLSAGRGFEERYGNVRFFSGEGAPGRELRSIIWCGLLDARLEALRRDDRLREIVRPLLGDDVRQVTNQLHYKFPGSRTSFQLHADRASRMRDQGSEIRNLDSCFYQTAIVTEPMDSEQRRHLLPARKPAVVRRKPVRERGGSRPPSGRGLPGDHARQVCPRGGRAGDVIVWHGNAVHGSALRHAGAGA